VTSESLAEGALYRAGYQHILSLKEIPPGLSLESLIPTLFGVKTQEVIDFSNQLATLIESGITILNSLKLLEEQTSKKSLKKIIDGLVEEIQGGNSLSQALGHYPQIFSNTYCQVIKASEQAGNLELGLRQAAGYLEKQAVANQKIKRAMLYPAFVLLMAIGVSILLITVALPPLVDLFESLGAELPWMTKLLMDVTGFFLDRSLYVLGGAVALVMLTLGLLRLPSVKIARDKFLLKIPAIGAINIERSVQHFCQTASMLLKAGLRLPQILEITIQTNRNRIIRQALSKIRDRLVQGEGLSQPLSEIELFPPLLVEMVVVGEKTGSMDSTFATLADFYEKKIDRRIDVLISMIEPALTVVIGLVVIFIALSMITPLYSILRSMH
ncbi:MAG: type II secretion system F family protein, partial [Dehalococcoidales bacterium]|nr:type II secretion system F family protein [Dehalococcoidales bacterium]